MKLTKTRAVQAIAVAAVSVAATTAVGIGPANASDAYPCGKVVYVPPAKHATGGYAQYCPITQRNVPVRASRSPSARIVGYLYQGGSANWFGYQWTGYTQHLGSYYNNWWATTEADNGSFGYVSEVYFKGGGNDERDATLRVNSAAP